MVILLVKHGLLHFLNSKYQNITSACALIIPMIDSVTKLSLHRNNR
jgi:hypothetical protein